MNENTFSFRAFAFYAFLTAALGAFLLIAGFFINRPQMFQSYLFGWLFWCGLSIGMLVILMTQYLITGAWSFLIRRILESGALLIPLMGLLMAPIILGRHFIYSWSLPLALNDEVLAKKSLYLNVPFFILRSVICFMFWTFLSWRLVSLSQARDRNSGAPVGFALRAWSAFGIIAHFILFTFAATDWAMSIEPRWFSSIYPTLLLIGQSLVGLAFAILSLWILSSRPALRGIITPQLVNDQGNMLLALIMLWAYMSFMQYLIIWNGNLPDDNTWYVHRSRGGWQIFAAALALLQFAMPFAFLLSRTAKRNFNVLVGIAATVFAAHILNVFWLIAPSFHPYHFHLHWLDVSAFLTLGGIWLGAFFLVLSRASLMPRHDAQFEGLLSEVRA